VIRITGVSSRFVGYFVAGFLILFGFFPVVGGIFQAIPNAVIYGATLLMFSLVGFAGYSIVASNEPVRRDWIIVAAAIVLGYTVSLSVDSMTLLSAEWAMILSFPVSTGAVFAIALELLLPKSKVQAQA
jgi:xanthine/uracil permease